MKCPWQTPQSVLSKDTLLPLGQISRWAEATFRHVLVLLQV